MKNILVIILLLFPFILSAQNQRDSLKYFLILNDGKTITSRQLVQKDRILKGGYILVNGTDKYDLKDVKSYRSSDGFFRKFPSKRSYDWYKLEEPGKINVYSRMVNASTLGTWNNGVYSGGYPYKRKDEYFQMGDEPPKDFKYAPLKNIMSDNPASLAVLKKGKNKKVAKLTLICLGAGMVIGGIAISLTKKESVPSYPPKQSKTKVDPLAIIGGLTFVSSFFVPNSEKDYRKAIALYNQQ